MLTDFSRLGNIMTQVLDYANWNDHVLSLFFIKNFRAAIDTNKSVPTLDLRTKYIFKRKRND
jgi:hypothetical protein